MNIQFPLQFDAIGHTATATDNGHIRDMIEQVLFTSPGERVNRPTFGSGLMQLVFQPNTISCPGSVAAMVGGYHHRQRGAGHPPGFPPADHGLLYGACQPANLFSHLFQPAQPANAMISSCCDPYRRTAVLESRDFNGIDFLEVRDNPTDPYAERQTVLYVHFLKPIVPGSLDVHNISMIGV